MSDVKPATTEERAEWLSLAEEDVSYGGFWGVRVQALEAALVQAETEYEKVNAKLRQVQGELSLVLSQREAECDAIANVARLTQKVETLHEALSDAESQIACRNEMRAAILRVEAERDEALEGRKSAWKAQRIAADGRDKARDRVRVLEQALETIDKHNRHHEDYMGSANEYTRAIRRVASRVLESAHRHDATKQVLDDRDAIAAELAKVNEELRQYEHAARARDLAMDARDAWQERYEVTLAKLAHAVAALRRAKDEDQLHCDCGCSELPDHAQGSIGAEVDAILADPDGAQAAEAWRELEAVYEAAKVAVDSGDLRDRRRLADALAAVDARRGKAGAK